MTARLLFMKKLSKFLVWLLSTGASASVAGLMVGAGFFVYEAQELPNIDEIMTTRLSVPMRVYSADGRLLYEFGKEKREPVTYSNACWALLQPEYSGVPEPVAEPASEPTEATSSDTSSETPDVAAAENTSTPEADTTTVTSDAETLDTATTDTPAETSTVDCRRRMQLVQAFLAAEDDEYFSHPGVDWKGLARAGEEALTTGRVTQGGSTITMQLPRNVEEVGLSRDQRIGRKLKEIVVALRLEKHYSKKAILERYLNVIYMGNSAYGVVTAAQRYYGKSIDELTLPEAAMLAGLPKAPGRYTPLAETERYRERARTRRNYVLRRMQQLNYITEAEKIAAQAEPLTAGQHLQTAEGQQQILQAGYVAEMARIETLKLFGNDADDYGLNVYTTIDSQLQDTAQKSVFNGLVTYDKRHGYRGIETHININSSDPDYEMWDDVLNEHESIGDLMPALVTTVAEQSFQAYIGTADPVTVKWPEIEWARRHLPVDERTRRQLRRGEDLGPKLEKVADVLAVGDVVLLRELPAPENSAESDNNDTAEPATIWALSQRPEAQSAFVALHPQSGAIKAIVGGIEFIPGRDEFNRATQSIRQPGSSFKPFVYSAALKYGFSPPSIVNDAPVVLPGYRPNNANHKIDGPIRVRDALRLSKNLVAIRLVQAIAKDERYSFEFLIKHLERFGFNRNRMPRELGLALGTAQLSPVELATAYTIFATDGYRVPTYFIERIEDRKGNVLYQTGAVDLCPKPCRRDGYYEEEEQIEIINSASTVAGEEDLFLPDLIATDELPEPVLPDTGLASLPAANMAPPPAVVLVEPVDPTSTQAIEIQPRIEPPRLAPQVIDPRNAFLMKSMMRSVVTGGTARAALQLDRPDIYGKTGTTNDQRDAWFAGFSPELIGVAWVGFDKRRVLGRREYGGDVALPIWLEFMQTALQDKPVVKLEAPEGITRLRVNRDTGRPTVKSDPLSRWDYMQDERLPEEYFILKTEEELRRTNPDEAPPTLTASELITDIFAPPPETIPAPDVADGNINDPLAADPNEPSPEDASAIDEEYNPENYINRNLNDPVFWQTSE